MENSSTLDVTFAGAPHYTFSIPISSLVQHNGTGPTQDDGQYAAACTIKIGFNPDPDLDGSPGSPFSRAMYTVFDLQNNIISVAPRNFNSTSDNIVEIPVGGVSQIPSSAYTSAPSPSSSSSASGHHTTTIGLGVGLGVGLPVLLAVCLGIFYLWRRKRNTASPPTEVNEVGTRYGELANNDPRYRDSELSSSAPPYTITPVAAWQNTSLTMDVAELKDTGFRRTWENAAPQETSAGPPFVFITPDHDCSHSHELASS
jgi:hypothetical protein